jgi:chemotaxis-related protein WspD
MTQALAMPAPGVNARDACWNRIGIGGDGSCAQLAAHVHCRNCPVYSSAAMTLLDGELPAGYRAHWTDHIAREKAAAESGMLSIMVFRLGAEWLALPTASLEEIATLRTIHALPHRRGGAVLGLANVRGELRACVSLVRLLGLHDAAIETSDATQARLLVLRHAGHSVASPVDEVHGVHRFHARELQEKPATVSLAAATYTKAVLPWRQAFVGMLDEHTLFRAIDRSLASASVI